MEVHVKKKYFILTILLLNTFGSINEGNATTDKPVDSECETQNDLIFSGEDLTALFHLAEECSRDAGDNPEKDVLLDMIIIASITSLAFLSISAAVIVCIRKRRELAQKKKFQDNRQPKQLENQQQRMIPSYLELLRNDVSVQDDKSTQNYYLNSNAYLQPLSLRKTAANREPSRCSEHDYEDIHNYYEIQ